MARGPGSSPGARFSKAAETFRTHKAIFSSSVSENGEVYTPETSCVKRTSGYIKNTRIKQLCNHKFLEFATAFRVRKLYGIFEKWAPGRGHCVGFLGKNLYSHSASLHPGLGCSKAG